MASWVTLSVTGLKLRALASMILLIVVAGAARTQASWLVEVEQLRLLTRKVQAAGPPVLAFGLTVA